jgi:hypothetical protein
VGQKETGENEGDVLRKGEAHASEDQKTEERDIMKLGSKIEDVHAFKPDAIAEEDTLHFLLVPDSCQERKKG